MRERDKRPSLLTGHEKRRLQQIACALRRNDPRIARLLTRGPRHKHAVDLLSVAGAGLMLAAIVIGIVLQLPLLCVTGWTGAIGLAILRGMYNDGA